MFKKLFILFIMIVLSIQNVGSIANYIYEPSCINPSYDSAGVFLVTSSNVSGYVRSVGVNEAGYFSPSTTRMHSTIRVLCTVSDPTTTPTYPGTRRIFGSTYYGDIFWTDSPDVNYSLGFYSEGYFGVCAVGGNCNPLYKIGTFASTAYPIKLTLDSSGNVYASDGYNIKKFVKSLGYTQQAFVTLVNGVSAKVSVGCTIGGGIIDLQVDSSDNLHVLGGSYCTGGGPGTSYLYKDTFDSSGNLIHANLTIDSDNGVGGSGFYTGGLVLDPTGNATFNYTYAYEKGSTGVNAIYHNSTTGKADVGGGALGGVASVEDIAYYNYQIFVASSASNVVQSFVTTYQGYIPTAGTTTVPATNTYTTATVNSLNSNYYNNSNFFLQYYVVGQTNAIRELDTFQTWAIYGTSISKHYKWKIELVDPAGVAIDSRFSGGCDLNVLNTECTIGGTLEYPVPTTNWTNGTWTANLYEYNIDTYTLAILDTSTFTVYFNSTTPIPEPQETLESGTGTTALSIIDGWVGLLGLGVNSISKFLFGMLITLSVMFFGFIATKFNSMGGAIAGALPYTFFVFVEFFPIWTVIIVVMVIALRTGWFK